MADMNDKLEQAAAEANSAVHRSSYQATNSKFGLDEQAMATLTGGSLPEQMPQPLQKPIDLLKMMSSPKEPELSLETLSEVEKEKILHSFTNCRDIANNHYRGVVEPEIIRRKNIYEASAEHYDKVFPQLSETSRWCSKDVRTTCEWILAGFMEVFTGSDEPLSVKGVNAEDDKVATQIQQLVRYQLEKKNDYHHFCLTMLKYALSENFAVAKVWWKREEKRTPMEMMLDIKQDEAIISMMDKYTSGKIDNIRLTDIEGATDFMKLEYDEVVVKANHPVVEYIPTSELRYTPDAATLQDCKFVAHRKVVRGDYLKRKELEGIYQNVDKAIEEYGTGNTQPTALDYKNDPDKHTRNVPNDSDLASKEVELYEAYMWVDYDNDGIFECLIVHAVGNHLLRVAVNEFEFPPFFICSTIYDPNVVFNKESFADNFEQLQDLKTAIMRQIITNVAKNNTPRIFVNEMGVDMDALLAGDEIIPTMGDPTTKIMTPPSLPLSSISMDVVNYAQNELENQSGSTRYNQGLDSNSLNSTATGITAIMGASEKRNKMMARAIAEKFFIPIYRFIILLNQKFLEEEQMVRLTNENVKIRREDIEIDYDLVINVGQGAGTREAQIQYLMMVLNQIYPQLTPVGIVNPKSYYNLVCKLLETLGLRDVAQYLLDPESPEAQQAAQQAAQMQAQAQAEAMENSIRLAVAKSSVPRVTVPITDFPADVQKQYIEKHLGIETTEEEIAKHELILNEK